MPHDVRNKLRVTSAGTTGIQHEVAAVLHAGANDPGKPETLVRRSDTRENRHTGLTTHDPEDDSMQRFVRLCVATVRTSGYRGLQTIAEAVMCVKAMVAVVVAVGEVEVRLQGTVQTRLYRHTVGMSPAVCTAARTATAIAAWQQQ